VPFVWPTVAGLFVQSVVTGLGFGVFIVVDQALFIDLLPHREAAAREPRVSTLGQNSARRPARPLPARSSPSSAAPTVRCGRSGSSWSSSPRFAVLPIKRAR